MSTSDRASLLARLRSRVGEAPPNLAHPVPPPVASVPVATSKLVDRDDLVGSFVANATAAGATVHRIASPADLVTAIDGIVTRHGVRRAVASKQREAWAAVEQLGARGVEIGPFDRTAAAAADLGVTAASFAIATTGTIGQRSDDVGGRGVSLLPRVHLCVVPASIIVASSADALRPLPATGLPSNVVLVTGPSKSADIEQILVTGVHGPVAIELCVVLDI